VPLPPVELGGTADGQPGAKQAPSCQSEGISETAGEVVQQPVGQTVVVVGGIARPSPGATYYIGLSRESDVITE